MQDISITPNQLVFHVTLIALSNNHKTLN